MNSVPMIELNDGHEIPQLGLGVFQIPPGETARTVAAALEIGYRHIDTAEGYRNERGVGDGVRASGLDRPEVFVTSKLDNRSHRPDDARRAFAGTLAELGFDYVDLFLIHWPVPSGDFVATWKVLEEFQREGRARSIGVSNFEVGHLQLLARESEIVPALNQIELHPYLQNREVDATTGRAGSLPRPGRRSCRARCSTIPRCWRSRRGSAGRLLRWCCAGTSSAATS